MQQALATGPEAPDLNGRVQILLGAPAGEREAALRAILQDRDEARTGLMKAAEAIDGLEQIVKNLSSPSLPIGIFRELSAAPQGMLAEVFVPNRGWQLLNVHDELDADMLEQYDEVVLSHDANVVLAKRENPVSRGGATGTVVQALENGKILLEADGQSIAVSVPGSLREQDLKRGDLLLFDRAAEVAFEKLQAPKRDDLCIQTPTVSFADIGGQEEAVRKMKEVLDLAVLHREIAEKYGVPAKASFLLKGPPGNGKTMLVKAAASYLSQHIPGGKCPVMEVRPGQNEEMWVGSSQKLWRQTFRAASAMAQELGCPVLLFFDEAESTFRRRDNSGVNTILDNILSAALVELDGLSTDLLARVIPCAATNRPDLMDEASVRRLGEHSIYVGRPNRTGARQIFAVHLPATTPCHIPGLAGGDARERLIDVAVSRLFQESEESVIATIYYRDSNRGARQVLAKHLVSGAEISMMVGRAKRSAALREVHTGRAGITAEDVLDSVAAFIEAKSGMLTPANAAHYVDDLPQDAPIARVEQPARRVKRAHQFITRVA
jgi:SpoVK/Ycf46/Vps4 family AAA+-type ATPase